MRFDHITYQLVNRSMLLSTTSGKIVELDPGVVKQTLRVSKPESITVGGTTDPLMHSSFDKIMKIIDKYRKDTGAEVTLESFGVAPERLAGVLTCVDNVRIVFMWTTRAKAKEHVPELWKSFIRSIEAVSQYRTDGNALTMDFRMLMTPNNAYDFKRSVRFVRRHMSGRMFVTPMGWQDHKEVVDVLKDMYEYGERVGIQVYFDVCTPAYASQNDMLTVMEDGTKLLCKNGGRQVKGRKRPEACKLCIDDPSRDIGVELGAIFPKERFVQT